MVKIIKEYSLPGNDEFWVEEVEADGKYWICISSHGLSDSHFFYFWSQAPDAKGKRKEELIDELVRRLQDVHDESDVNVLRRHVKFDTPGWDQWTFGTPRPLMEYLYGPSVTSPDGSAG
jgi:hypothetical protein